MSWAAGFTCVVGTRAQMTMGPEPREEKGDRKPRGEMGRAAAGSPAGWSESFAARGPLQLFPRVAVDPMTSPAVPLVRSLWAEDSLKAVLLSTIKDLPLGLFQVPSDV